MKLKTRVRRGLDARGWYVPGFLLDEARRDMRSLAKKMTRADIVIDLGAHVGLATCEFAARAGHVHAFEPNPANFARLKERTADLSNVTLHQKAVSDREGTTRLYFEEPEAGKFFEGASIVKDKSNLSYANGVEVETVDLGAFVKSLDRPVSVIKMDIEGAEYMVLDRLLASGAMDRIGKVFAECHVDRIPGLAEHKAQTLRAFEAAGQRDKLDFDWQ